jgi:chaperonin GroES
MESPIIPLGDKIIILPQEEGEQTYGNIIIPDAGQEKPEMGKVLAVGPGRISTDGTLIPNRIEVGVTVMVPKFGAQVVVVENETYIVAGESDVLGIIKQKDETYPEFTEKHYKKENNE